MTPLLAVRNFAQVQPGLYRGAQPVESFELQWLRELGVNTCANLRAEAEDPEAPGLARVQFPVVDDQAPSQKQLRVFCAMVAAELAAGRGVFFHCGHGHGRTSTFCAAWSVYSRGLSATAAIREEARRYGYELDHPGQVAALEAFWEACKLDRIDGTLAA